MTNTMKLRLLGIFAITVLMLSAMTYSAGNHVFAQSEKVTESDQSSTKSRESVVHLQNKR